MRVLVIPKDFPTPENPQAGIFILRRLQAMQARGHEIFVLRITPYAPPFGGERWAAYRAIPRDTEVEGIPVRTVRALVPPRMIGIEYMPLQLGAVVAAEIARVKADIVHASYILPCGHIAVRQRVPSIVTMHGVDAHTWPKRRTGIRNATREVLRKATQMTAVSGFLADVIQDVEPCDVRVIWNGADERFFSPQPREAARRALAIDEKRCVITYAGVVEREKGVYDLLDAVERLKAERPLLVIAGTGPESEPLERLAEQRHVELKVLGRVSQPQVAQAYAAADIVTLASYIEGLPNVICEAMLCERAIVSTAVGGVPEIVQHERSGLLTPIGDPVQLAAALQRAAASPELRHELAANAREFALQHLTWKNSSRKYEELYHDVRERPARAVTAARPAMNW